MSQTVPLSDGKSITLRPPSWSAYRALRQEMAYSTAWAGMLDQLKAGFALLIGPDGTPAWNRESLPKLAELIPQILPSLETLTSECSERLALMSLPDGTEIDALPALDVLRLRDAMTPAFMELVEAEKNYFAGQISRLMTAGQSGIGPHSKSAGLRNGSH